MSDDSAERANPLGQPPNQVSDEQIKDAERAGGFGGKGKEVPTILRNIQKNVFNKSKPVGPVDPDSFSKQ